MASPAREIPLSNGGAAVVDDEDFELLCRWKWRKGPDGYAMRVSSGRRRADGTRDRRTFRMHRQVMGNDPATQYDHIDGDRLNNRKANLRPASTKENAWNGRRHRDGASRYKGVSWRKQQQQWCAKFGHDGRYVFVGLFHSEEEAARAYDEAIRPLRGAFGRFNFPREGERSALK